MKPLPGYINEKTNRVHGNFNQIGAITGRFSSDRPNLQNIPIRDELGRSIRKAFTAEKGNVLLAFDYSQQELRILAEVSGEERLVEAFNSGKDIHAATASDLFDIPIEKVNKSQRRVGKTINFGIVYGISPFGLADRLKIDNKKAAGFIDKYFARYPKVRKYFDNLLASAQSAGYVYTILGRKKSTAMLSAGNYMVREAAKREVMNFPLQGSAADFMKLGMIQVANFIKDYPAKIILQIHDEILIEYNRDQDHNKLDEFVKRVINSMMGVAELSVPLEVDAEIGENWLKMSEYPMAE